MDMGGVDVSVRRRTGRLVLLVATGVGVVAACSGNYRATDGGTGQDGSVDSGDSQDSAGNDVTLDSSDAGDVGCTAGTQACEDTVRLLVGEQRRRRVPRPLHRSTRNVWLRGAEVGG